MNNDYHVYFDALRREGLRVSGAEQLHLPRVEATDSPRGVPQVEVALFCVERYVSVEAARLMLRQPWLNFPNWSVSPMPTCGPVSTWSTQDQSTGSATTC